MPEVKNCKRCRQMFMHAVGPQLCEACKKLDEEDFLKVRKFVRDFPGASMVETADNTGVSQATIHKYLRDGRLEVAEGSAIAINCEACGARITSGRFCVACSQKLAKDMMSAGKTLQTNEPVSTENKIQKNAGLRYMDNKKRDT